TNDRGKYHSAFPSFAAILSSYHVGRSLTRPCDGRSLPLRTGVRDRGGLTAAEERLCLHSQWKLYTVYKRVIKDYAAVFSFGDDWDDVGEAEENPSSLVYSGDTAALHFRVNAKARPEVYNIVSDVLNNRCKEWEELPTGLGLKTTWNLLWTWSKPHIQYSSLLVWQKVNHFPNSRELTRKDRLSKHISRFMAHGSQLAKEFHVMPETFTLPHEFTQFVAAFTSSTAGGEGSMGRKHVVQEDNVNEDNGDSSEKEETQGGFAEGTGSCRWNDKGLGRGSRKDEQGLWIMKPVGMSRGRGIRLIDDISSISYSDKVVVQRYLHNPLLLDGYKFDLRLYVLVSSFNRLEAFIYREGFARLSTHRYKKGDIDNRFIHLTNS
ncbi:unnamed protein product, partial [Choristocarpus tenellus]